jgi:DNA-binding PadR family transcriptional regulator
MFRDFAHGPHRLFNKGDFKYLILDLLKEKPHYGYEIIRALEERFHGFYAPSPGVVYPTLQMLEEMGYITGVERDGKRVYSITESGLSFLSDREKAGEEFRSKMEKWWNPEINEEFHKVKHELRNTGRLIWQSARGLNREKLEEIRDVIVRARRDIQAILERTS